MDPKEIVGQALSPFDYFCDGFGSPGASGRGYFLGLVLSVGKAPLELGHSGSRVLDAINAFDRAETESAYLGQINMSLVSSFCGVSGLIWGYHVVKNNPLRRSHALAPKKVKLNGRSVRIYSTSPIIEATEALLGTVTEKHFPFLPGAHVPCAGRFFTKIGPAHLYCAIALGINGSREQQAHVLMEDVGELPFFDSEVDGLSYRTSILENIAKSVLRIGENQKIKYERVLVGFRDLKVEGDKMGCVLVAAPYFTLARKAVPNGDVTNLLQMTFKNWEKTTRQDFLFRHQKN